VLEDGVVIENNVIAQRYFVVKDGRFVQPGNSLDRSVGVIGRIRSGVLVQNGIIVRKCANVICESEVSSKNGFIEKNFNDVIENLSNLNGSHVSRNF
jgi:hypothetical protein